MEKIAANAGSPAHPGTRFGRPREFLESKIRRRIRPLGEPAGGEMHVLFLLKRADVTFGALRTDDGGKLALIIRPQHFPDITQLGAGTWAPGDIRHMIAQ